jgi:drug/metabolite transporter (DMT)-like permease
MSGQKQAAVSPTVHLALLAVQLMFGSFPAVGKILYGYGHITPLGIAAARTAGGTLAFWAVIALTRQHQPLVRSAHLGKLALFGLLGVTVNQIFFLWGLDYTTALNASVLVTTIPIFTALLVILLGHERARRGQLVGIALAFAGVGIVAEIESFDLSSRAFLGNGMVVLNAFSFSLFLVLSRPLLKIYSPLMVTAWVFAFGSLYTLPLGAVPLANAVPGFTAAEWALLLYIIVVPTVVAYFLNSWSLKRAPASIVSVYIYLQPVTAGLMAALLLGEALTLRLLIGALAIFLGIFLASRRRG